MEEQSTGPATRGSRPAADGSRTRPRPRIAGLAAVGLIVTSTFVGAAITSAPDAAAAPVLVDGCTTFQDDGTTPIDLDAVIDPEDPTTEAMLEDYQSGDYLVIGTAFGPEDPGEAPADSTPPLCAVQVTYGTGGVVSFGPPTWLWCTEAYDSPCAGSAMAPSANVLDDEQLALVGWILRQHDLSGDLRKWSFNTTQARIWCVTDSDGSAIDDGLFVPSDPTIATCEEYLVWLDDNVVPGLATEDDTLTVNGPTEPVDVGTEQRLEVTSTVERLALDPGTAQVTVCSDDSSGSTLDGTTLTLGPGGGVTLCATSESAGTIVFLVESAEESGLIGQQYGFDDPDCQVLITGDIEVFQLTAMTTAVWEAQAGPTTTTSTTTTALPATTSTTTVVTTIAPNRATTTTAASGRVPGGGPGTSGTSGGRSSAQPAELAVTGLGATASTLLGLALLITGLAFLVGGRRQGPCERATSSSRSGGR